MPQTRLAGQTGRLGLNFKGYGDIDQSASAGIASINTQPFSAGTTQGQTQAAAHEQGKAGIMPAFIGLLTVVFLLGYAERKMRDGKPDQTIMGVSVFNIMAVGAMASIFILTLKVVVNIRPIPGLTQLANAI